MARTGARSVCLSVASVPFFGGGGRFGRSWGMRQSRPGCCARSWCAARRAWLAVAPSNAMRAACGELAVALLIVAMKTYRKHVLGRAMIPRPCCMGGRQRLHSNQAASKLCFPHACRGPPAVCRSLCEGFCRRVRQQSFARVCRMPPRPSEVPGHCATLLASHHHIKAGNESLCHLPTARFANYSKKDV